MIVKPGGTGKTDAAHLGKVGAFAAEQGFHGTVAVGLAVAEVDKRISILRMLCVAFDICIMFFS